MRTMSIGQLAKDVGVGVETVRFYERKGLLDVPARKDSGYRQYDDEAVERLRFIRKAQQVGFTLKEIQDLLALRDDPDARRADVRERAAGKIADIDAKVRDRRASSIPSTIGSPPSSGDGKTPWSTLPNVIRSSGSFPLNCSQRR